MLRHLRVGLALVTLLVAPIGTIQPSAQVSARASIEGIRHELLQLPYYGVFDFLAFSYDKGVVTLMGYAYHANLKSDAERAVRRAPEVKEIANKIEELPVSTNDDELRWRTYYAIYSDPFLSRYAPGGGTLWGHRHRFGPGLRPLSGGPFSGMEPAGDYPIHIIVKNGRVMLFGVVDNESDKTLATVKARQVPGTFGVENELMVEKAGKTERS